VLVLGLILQCFLMAVVLMVLGCCGVVKGLPKGCCWVPGWLQGCCRFAKGLLQACCRVATGLLQCCYSVLLQGDEPAHQGCECYQALLKGGGETDGQTMDLQCFLMGVVMNESEQIRKLRLNLSGS
jgi:hypothetical protein